MKIDGADARYLMGDVAPVTSSVLTSNSRYLNNPRVRDVYAQMGLKRDALDLPPAFLVPEINRALAEETDFAEIERQLSAERTRLPEFARWLDERFVSNWTLDVVQHCSTGTVGGLIRDFISASGFEIDFMFRGEPRNDFEYLNKRRVQNHDIEHLVTGLDPSPVGEIALIVANAVAIYDYFSPDFAQSLSIQPMFLTSTSLMRAACHYPQIVPAMLEGIAIGHAVGKCQSKPLFMIKWEDWIDTSVEEVREELGFRDGPAKGHWDWTYGAARG